MSRIAPELDRLMWELAEADEPTAIEEFGDRYPHCRNELAKRLRVTRTLKTSRPSKSPAKFRPTSRIKSTPRWVFAAAFTLLLAALGLAGFAVSKLVLGDSSTPNEFQTTDRAPRSVGFGSEFRPGTPPSNPTGMRMPNQGVNPNLPDPRNGDVLPVEDGNEPNLLDNPVTLDASPIALHDALRAIAQRAGFRIEISPDTPNPEVVVSYYEMPAGRILESMSQNFGFRAIDQGRDGVVILPDATGSGGDPSNRTEPIFPGIRGDIGTN